MFKKHTQLTKTMMTKGQETHSSDRNDDEQHLRTHSLTQNMINNVITSTHSSDKNNDEQCSRNILN